MAGVPAGNDVHSPSVRDHPRISAGLLEARRHMTEGLLQRLPVHREKKRDALLPGPNPADHALRIKPDTKAPPRDGDLSHSVSQHHRGG